MFKRNLALLALLCCLAAAVPAPATEGAAPSANQYSGYLVTYQGHKIEVLRFKNLLPNYIFRYQSVIQSLPLEQIKSLTIKSGGIILEKREGVTLKVVGNLVISSGPALEFIFKDPVTGKDTEGQMDPILVNLVVFN